MPTPVTVTPVNRGHALFGLKFTVLEQDLEWFVTEIKDGIHDLVVKFKKSDVTEVATPLQAPAGTAA